MEKGKVFVFFGASGTGKDHIMKSFIEYCNSINIPSVPCKRYLTRSPRIDEKNDEFQQFGLSESDIHDKRFLCVKINEGFLAIDPNDIEKNIIQGKNTAVVTGSIDLINELLNSNIKDNVILIYITAFGLSLDYYLKLEKRRNPTLDEETLSANAQTRFNQSKLVNWFYSENKEVFNYSYANVTKNASPKIADMYKTHFFSNFFDEILGGQKKGGPNWTTDQTNKGK